MNNNHISVLEIVRFISAQNLKNYLFNSNHSTISFKVIKLLFIRKKKRNKALRI